VSLWLLTVSGAPAGYFELRRDNSGGIEIAYFGLLPEFTGRRLGGHLLTVAVETAWAAGTNRIWLHTNTLDHPAALPNYLKRGFTAFDSETYTPGPPDPGGYNSPE
jgi:GNAT superfamily N-acetyltransferase